MKDHGFKTQRILSLVIRAGHVRSSWTLRLPAVTSQIDGAINRSTSNPVPFFSMKYIARASLFAKIALATNLPCFTSSFFAYSWTSG